MAFPSFRQPIADSLIARPRAEAAHAEYADGHQDAEHDQPVIAIHLHNHLHGFAFQSMKELRHGAAPGDFEVTTLV
jgi:hypothetical protein